MEEKKYDPFAAQTMLDIYNQRMARVETLKQEMLEGSAGNMSETELFKKAVEIIVCLTDDTILMQQMNKYVFPET